MSDDNSTSIQEKKNEPNEIKMMEAQNIIKKKFGKAYANRLEQENDLIQAVHPLQTDSSNDATSLSIIKQPRTLTLIRDADINNNNCKQDHETSVQYIKNANIIRKSFINPNEMCDRLRKIFSLMTVGETEYVEEMNAIIMKLRELEILQ